MNQLKRVATRLRDEAGFYRRVLVHPSTPLLPKALLWLALAYLASPVDLIPDFVPVLGHLDDLLVVPLLVMLAMSCVPKELRDDCRR